jgi:hypothetical protein
MADKKEAEETKKSEVLYSEDVSEMVDIYVQMDEIFKKSKIAVPPTSEDIQKMVTSIFIQRGNTRGRSEKTDQAETAPSKGDRETRDCPNCGKVLSPKTSKNGKSYFACDTCKGFANSDGTFTPFKR